MKRSLSLRREALADLGDGDLSALAGGTVTRVAGCGPSLNTCASCLDYISCHWWQCVLRRTVRECVDFDTLTCA